MNLKSFKNILAGGREAAIELFRHEVGENFFT